MERGASGSAIGATETFARFIVETPTSSLPVDVVDAARRAILDTIGVTLAGSAEPVGKVVAAQASAQGGPAESTIWGTSAKVSAQNAALANGAAAHALDYDDTHDAMRGHPSVPVLPAVFALGERYGSSGAEVLAAFAIGVEVACALGQLTGQEPYDRGWHVTATHGVVGATAGAGRLAGLSVAEMRQAIGIAVSHASGVRQNFGTMTKPLHVGRAAQAAIFAVELIQRGFTASPEAIEGDVGYWVVLGRDARYSPDELAVMLGNPFQIVSPGVNVKAYPCCASTHAAIDIALEVADGLMEAEIDRVIVEVPYTAPLILIHHRPADPLSAKFSLEYCVAAALLDGAVTLDHFTEQAVERADLQALLRRVECVVPSEWQTSDGTAKTGFARIDVHLSDGTVRHAETDVVLGSPGRPLSDAQLEAKFLTCARRAIGDEQAQAALTSIREFEHLDQITQLARQLAVDPTLVGVGRQPGVRDVPL